MERCARRTCLPFAGRASRGDIFVQSFRNVFSYFARRVKEGGFPDPQSIHRHQQLWDQQVCVTFLLGLDWTIPADMQRIRLKEKARQQLRKLLAEEEGATLRDFIPDSAELRTRLTLAERRGSALRQSLNSLRVVEQYHDLEKEADQLTAEIAQLSDDNSVDRQIMTDWSRPSQLRPRQDRMTLSVCTRKRDSRKESEGVSSMQIFCFDLTMMQLMVDRDIGPGFLVHDSHLFDGVDARQIANAIRVADETARALEVQYITAINSDVAAEVLVEGEIDIKPFALNPVLPDEEGGGLLGQSFGDTSGYQPDRRRRRGSA